MSFEKVAELHTLNRDGDRFHFKLGDRYLSLVKAQGEVRPLSAPTQKFIGKILNVTRKILFIFSLWSFVSKEFGLDAGLLH